MTDYQLAEVWSKIELQSKNLVVATKTHDTAKLFDAFNALTNLLQSQQGNMMRTDDRRTKQQKTQTALYVIALDSFLSGWKESPNCPKNSFYVIACPDNASAQIAKGKLKKRPEMKMIRVNTQLPQTQENDHVSIVWHENLS